MTRRIRIYRMPWCLNYKRPQFFRLKDGWMIHCLSFVLILGK